MPQMLQVPAVAFTSFGCIGQMYPLVVVGMSFSSGLPVPVSEALLSDLSPAWWIVNGWLAGIYVAAMIVVRDGE